MAVKVPYRGESAALARETLAEPRAGAGLRHPGFVQILDAEMDPDGVPYLILELADRGSWESVVGEAALDWDTIGPCIDEVLAALGHAHAQGLVHRDIKPDNLLGFSDGTARVSLRISDFGLAKVLDRGRYGESRLSSGTLLYMPPEAFSNEVRGIHPGVDLYAVGVILYRLICGRRPWDAEDLSLVMAKITGAPRAFEPRTHRGFPDRLEAVVTRLLHPDPAARYALAAEVRDDLAGRRTRRRDPQVEAGDADHSQFQGVVTDFPAAAPAEAVPRAHPPTAAIALVREPRWVDREAERALLWERARGAVIRPTGLAIHGPRGHGRTRLIRGLTTTLEEAGLARSLWVRLSDGASPMEATANALRHHLVLGTGAGEELGERIQAWFAQRGGAERDEVSALTGWLDSGAVAGDAVASPAQVRSRRLALLDRVLRAEITHGLAVLVLEEGDRQDVAAAELAADFLRATRGRPFPLLILYENHGGTQPLELLSDFERVRVGPLADADIDRIVADLCPASLRPAVGRLRLAGDPSRAVESIRSSLSSTLATAVLAPAQASDPAATTRLRSAEISAEETLAIGPEEIARVRLEHFIEDAPSPESAGRRVLLLSLLSLLPRPVAPSWFDLGWRILAPTNPDSGIAEARLAGVLHRDDEGAIDFASAALADAAASLVRAHPGTAAMRGPLGRAFVAVEGTPQRRHGARLLAAAGAWEDAHGVLVPLARGAQGADAALAETLWAEAGHCLECAGIGVGDPRAVEAWLGGARAARDQGDLDGVIERLGSAPPADPQGRAPWWEIMATVRLIQADFGGALAAADEALREYRAVSDRAGVARASSLRGDALGRAGRRAEGRLAYDEAVVAARIAGAMRELLWALWMRGRSSRALDHRAEARTDLEEALALARHHRVAAVEGGALLELGNLATREGRQEEAERYFAASTQRLEAAGLRGEAAVTRISSGELARARGDLAAARTHYAGALAICRAFQLRSEGLAALLNLALTELARGQPLAAGRRVAEIDQELARGTPHALRAHIEAVRACVLAEQGDVPGSEEALGAWRDAPSQPDPDLLFVLERLGLAAGARGETLLAGDALGAAMEIAQAIGDEPARKRIRGALATVG